VTADQHEHATMKSREIAALGRRAGARVLVDGALAFGQIPVDITALDCDYYATSLLKSAAPYAIAFAQAEADWNALNDRGGARWDFAFNDASTWVVAGV
jgi:selenocysteine lyase/cysteine desulfurase